MKNYKAIILAAGMGKRMNSELPKALGMVYDKTIIGELISSLNNAGIKDICIVIGHKGDEVKAALKDIPGISYASQTEQLGTGHAVMQAKGSVSPADNVLVVNGDMPHVEPATLTEFIEQFEGSDVDLSIVTATPEITPAYGRIIRDTEGYVSEIVEEKDAAPETKAIKEVNYGIYLFSGEILLKTLDMLDNNNASSEYYITDTIGHAISLGKKVSAYILKDASEARGVNTRLELENVTKTILRNNCLHHMANGVTIVSVDNTFIGSDVVIGKDTMIYPGVNLMGNCVIGDRCVISPNTTLDSATIPSFTKV